MTPWITSQQWRR